MYEQNWSLLWSINTNCEGWNMMNWNSSWIREMECWFLNTLDHSYQNWTVGWIGTDREPVRWTIWFTQKANIHNKPDSTGVNWSVFEEPIGLGRTDQFGENWMVPVLQSRTFLCLPHLLCDFSVSQFTISSSLPLNWIQNAIFIWIYFSFLFINKIQSSR